MDIWSHFFSICLANRFYFCILQAGQHFSVYNIHLFSSYIAYHVKNRYIQLILYLDWRFTSLPLSQYTCIDCTSRLKQVCLRCLLRARHLFHLFLYRQRVTNMKHSTVFTATIPWIPGNIQTSQFDLFPQLAMFKAERQRGPVSVCSILTLLSLSRSRTWPAGYVDNQQFVVRAFNFQLLIPKLGLLQRTTDSS